MAALALQYGYQDMSPGYEAKGLKSLHFLLNIEICAVFTSHISLLNLKLCKTICYLEMTQQCVLS